MDIIFLGGLKTQAVIGVCDWERQVEQTVCPDLDIGHDVRKAAPGDEIDTTVSYKSVAQRVMAFVSESRLQLLEALAEGVAAAVLEQFDTRWARVTAHQPGALRDARDAGVVVERGEGR